MNPLKSKVAKVMIIRHLLKKLKRKSNKIYVRQIFLNRIFSGENVLVREMRDDVEYHKKYFRMSRDSFDRILNLIKEDIKHELTHACPISPLERLAITLRYLASGSSQLSLAMSYRISPTSVSRILRETMAAVCKHLIPEHLPKPNKETWTKSEARFSKKWNFPNCCGSLDGKHIRIQAPKQSGSMHFNYKGYFSIVLLAVVDPNYRFLVTDIGACGSISDGGVLQRSSVGNAIQQGTKTLVRANSLMF